MSGLAWAQDVAARNAPWRAEGFVAARSDKGWWKLWKRQDDGAFVLQRKVFGNANDAKAFAEGLASA